MPAHDRHGRRLAPAAAMMGVVLGGCLGGDCTSEPGAALWASYMDSLGTGSAVRVEEFFGDLEADLTKAADPPQGTRDPRYPYVGLVVFVSSDKSGIDVGKVDHLSIEYQSSGPLHVLVEQQGMASGEDFRAPLPQSSSSRTATFKLDAATFRQPSWVQRSSAITERLLLGIKFQILDESGARVHLILRTLKLEGKGVCIRKRES